MPTIRFGTRGSALARAQADLVIDRVRAMHPEIDCHPVIVRTEGDRDTTTPLTVIGGRGIFTSALQDALRHQRIDAAVHSAKDLPTNRPTDLTLIATLAREDPRDVFVTRHSCPLAALGPHPVIGTSSRRRAVQVQRLRPDARIVDLRGNIDTRLRKARETELDGIVLAAAGVTRMGWSDRIVEYLPLEIAVPSPGQGALAVEIRADETGRARMLAELDEPPVAGAVQVERAFLQGVGGGCATPIGAHAVVEDDQIRLMGMLASEEGDRAEWVDVRFPVNEAEESARLLARDLLRQVERRFHPSSSPHVEMLGPLAGKRVLITRGGEHDPLPTLISERGGKPIVVPTSRIAEPTDPTALVRAVDRLLAGAYDWVVFTSGNAVERVCARLNGSGLRLSDTIKVAAVGRATAARLEERGIAVSLVPEEFTGEALVDVMSDAGVVGANILFPHGDLARETVPHGLTRAGAIVDRVEAYRTVAVTEIDDTTRARLDAGSLDAAVFLSPSSVRNLSTLFGGRLDLLADAVVVCIGPVTAEAARSLGLPVHVVPAESTVPATVEALERYFANLMPVGTISGQPVEGGNPVG